jgi:hypothetical protein
MWLQLEGGGWVAEYPVSDTSRSNFKPVCKMLTEDDAKREEMAAKEASTSIEAEGGGLSFLAIDPDKMKRDMDPRLRKVLIDSGINIGENLEGAENDKVSYSCARFFSRIPAPSFILMRPLSCLCTPVLV